MTGKRLFGESDVGALLKRATELQVESEQDPTLGLSLDELEQIAGDLGIDPSFLQKAATEFESRSAEEGGVDIWGGPFKVDEHCIVEGHISRDDWEQLVQELRFLSGEDGTVIEQGSLREWTRKMEGLDYTQVSISDRGNQTVVRLRDKFGGYAAIWYGCTFPVFFGLSLASYYLSGLPPTPALGIALTALVSILGVERFILSRWARKRRIKGRDLVNRIRESVVQPESGVRDPAQLIGERSGNTPARLDDVPDEESQVGTLPHKTRIR